MSAVRWSPGILLPARIVSALDALRRTVPDLQAASERGEDSGDLVARTREAFDRLQQFAAASDLGYLDFARHLRFAERHIAAGQPVDAADLADMGQRDISALVRRIEEREALPPDTASLRAAQASLEGPSPLRLDYVGIRVEAESLDLLSVECVRHARFEIEQARTIVQEGETGAQ